MAIPSLRLVVNSSLALSLLAGNALAFWPFYSAKQQMQAFCQSLPAGLSAAAVLERAQAEAYEFSTLDDGQAIVEDPLSYGRRECRLRFERGTLVSAG